MEAEDVMMNMKTLKDFSFDPNPGTQINIEDLHFYLDDHVQVHCSGKYFQKLHKTTRMETESVKKPDVCTPKSILDYIARLDGKKYVERPGTIPYNELMTGDYIQDQNKTYVFTEFDESKPIRNLDPTGTYR
jgi:hypothetical protein